MKCGFYEEKTNSMIQVEPWKQGISGARAASINLTMVYQQKNHKIPSPVWCVWDGKDVASVFLLDMVNMSPDLLDKASAACKLQS